MDMEAKYLRYDGARYLRYAGARYLRYDGARYLRNDVQTINIYSKWNLP